MNNKDSLSAVLDCHAHRRCDEQDVGVGPRDPHQLPLLLQPEHDAARQLPARSARARVSHELHRPQEAGTADVADQVGVLVLENNSIK